MTGVFGLLTVLFAGTAMAGGQKLTDTNERKDDARSELADVRAEATEAQTELSAREDALREVEAELAELRRYFSADAIAAVNEVQAQLIEGGCEQARTATRNGIAPPSTPALVDYAVATVPPAQPPLEDLDGRWGDLLDLGPVEEEVASCAADEQALIDAELAAARAAEEAAQAAEAEPFCDEPLFVTGYCPTQEEIDFENQAEAICGPGTEPGSPWYDFCHGLGPPP